MSANFTPKWIPASESKIGFENRDPGFEFKTETGFQNQWKPVFKEPKIAFI